MDYPSDRAEDDRNSKFLSEIYLTRLLKAKVGFKWINLEEAYLPILSKMSLESLEVRTTSGL